MMSYFYWRYVVAKTDIVKPIKSRCWVKDTHEEKAP